jgi:hypothetical protein
VLAILSACTAARYSVTKRPPERRPRPAAPRCSTADLADPLDLDPTADLDLQRLIDRPRADVAVTL